MSKTYHIFTDGSADPHTRYGFGAKLITENVSSPTARKISLIETKLFANTSSTQLELLTLLWALECFELQQTTTTSAFKIKCYTDSNNIIGLPQRQARLEQKDYLNNKGFLIKNHNLYRRFYTLTAKLNCEFIKVIGHQPSNKKGTVDELFTLVDKGARDALRKLNINTSKDNE